MSIPIENDSSQETDVFSEENPMCVLGKNMTQHNNNEANSTTYMNSYINRRRASLDIHPVSAAPPMSCARRSSIGASIQHKSSARRSSLGEDALRLNLLQRSCFRSAASIPRDGRRHSVESDSFLHNSCRRSSLGAESLIEYDMEQDISDTEAVAEPPPEALLGLQYADDVFAVKRELEVHFHPRNSLSTQPQVTALMRCTLVNWLVKIRKSIKFGAETIFLAVHLMDRFLLTSAITSDCCQLLAVTSLFVAAKMEESKVPGISGLASLCSASYQHHHFKRMEILLLTKLGFELHAASSLHFINYLSLKACQLGYLDRNVSRLARRVAETCLCQYKISQFLPSVQAGAALVYAVETINPEVAPQIKYWLHQAVDENSDATSDVSCLRNIFEDLNVTGDLGEINECSKFESCDSVQQSSIVCSSCSEDSMLSSYWDVTTSSATIEKLINIIHILFTREEKDEIVLCSKLMSYQMAAYGIVQSPVISNTNENSTTSNTMPSNYALTSSTSTFPVTSLSNDSGTEVSYLTTPLPSSNLSEQKMINVPVPAIAGNAQTLIEKVELGKYKRRDSGISTTDIGEEKPMLLQHLETIRSRERCSEETDLTISS